MACNGNRRKIPNYVNSTTVHDAIDRTLPSPTLATPPQVHSIHHTSSEQGAPGPWRRLVRLQRPTRRQGDRQSENRAHTFLTVGKQADRHRKNAQLRTEGVPKTTRAMQQQFRGYAPQVPGPRGGGGHGGHGGHGGQHGVPPRRGGIGTFWILTFAIIIILSRFYFWYFCRSRPVKRFL